MPLLHTSTFIRRSAAECREVFLDFPSWDTWHTGFMKSIKPLPATPSTTPTPIIHGSSPVFTPGAKLEVVLDGLGTITPVLLQNDDSGFKWRGGNLWVGFQGDHAFRWEEATENGVHGTRMVHEELFSGFLSSLVMGENFVANLIGLKEESEINFSGWTEEFKKRCEEGAVGHEV